MVSGRASVRSAAPFINNKSGLVEEIDMEEYIFRVGKETWVLFWEAAVFVVFGLTAAGILRMFLNPEVIVRHFGRGPIRSVLKAAVLGIPIPL